MENIEKNGLCIRGEVEIYDGQTNEPIFKGHNMIVENGRKYIRNLFLKQNIDLIGNTPNEDITTLKFKDIHFGGSNQNNANRTKQTVLKDNSLENELSGYTIDITKEQKPGNYAKATFEVEQNRIKIEIQLRGKTEPVVLEELGIFLSDGEMFSRISFDGIYMDAATSVQINYYIYF